MTPDRALSDLREGKLSPVYLVAGEERHLATDVVRAIREAALAGATPGLNDEQLVAGETTARAVITAARTLPMFAKRRLVVVRNLERWDAQGEKKANAEALDLLADYLDDPSPSTVLLLVAGKLDKRRRLYVSAQKKDYLVACEPLKRDALPGWITRAMRERGNTAAPGVADLIAELAGPELGAVADAVERVCLFAGQGAAVTEDHVAECIVRLRPTTVWELVDAVGARDTGRALASLAGVYDPSDRGLRLVGVLAWSARQLLKFESATRGGASPEEAAKRAGAPPFKARDLARQVKQIPRPQLEAWLETLAGLDFALKGGSKRPPQAVLEHAILALCTQDRVKGRAASPRPA
ncbi:MAG: DNA polymerase III subunit delta [Polyangiaceae bacterium]|nr:DNA polymerase III subunit delta [Polyangiaceae bacterium]